MCMFSCGYTIAIGYSSPLRDTEKLKKKKKKNIGNWGKHTAELILCLVGASVRNLVKGVTLTKVFWKGNNNHLCFQSTTSQISPDHSHSNLNLDCVSKAIHSPPLPASIPASGAINACLNQCTQKNQTSWFPKHAMPMSWCHKHNYVWLNKKIWRAIHFLHALFNPIGTAHTSMVTWWCRLCLHEQN